MFAHLQVILDGFRWLVNQYVSFQPFVSHEFIYINALLTYYGFIYKHANIVLFGLDGAGKSTLMNMLLHNRPHASRKHRMIDIPIKRVGTIFHTTHLPGHFQARRIWELAVPEYPKPDFGLVYIVDATAPERFAEAREALEKFLKLEGLKGVPLLVLGNKFDEPMAVEREGMVRALGLERLDEGALGDRPVNLVRCSAVYGIGYEDGFRWLSKVV
ncbi:P-loop containing nucleoside triphosphate hydrolase protein [Lepidopterella palustris CBS 459.81]|uniref:P-loop containing nucleoside triphosphate hydrolase protein n=1 Tax=Lepidopterella palustris CBS 459.81 TaxID=1314670 RepID=A0A8E2EDT7_9PEZI|nr:P-loop containing nucleoside triphosphate hydrolase protein [Lepidopterella palustris CBS 459.81]